MSKTEERQGAGAIGALQLAGRSRACFRAERAAAGQESSRVTPR